MRIRCIETIEDFRKQFNLVHPGRLLERDLDVVKNPCDLYQRKRRDAEVLCTLAANARSHCLDLAASQGRSAFKLSTNLKCDARVFTVSFLPDESIAEPGRLTARKLMKEEIDAFYRGCGLSNVVQLEADASRWMPPPEVRDLSVLFVDAPPDADRVHAETAKCFELLRPGGFVCWHDFSPELRSEYEWIDSAMRGVERFMKKFPPDAEVVHLRDSWIGVFQKPDNQAACFQDLPSRRKARPNRRSALAARASAPASRARS